MPDRARPAWTGRDWRLTGSRGVALTPRCTEDVDEFFAALDGSRNHVGHWLPWVDSVRSVRDAERLAREAEVGFTAGSDAIFTLRVDGHVVGSVGLHGLSGPNASAELGYWLTKPATGRGLAAAACRVVLDWAFGVAGLHRVFAQVTVGNNASARVVERLGFRAEGRLREAVRLRDRFGDFAVYGILRQEWAAARDAPRATR